MSEIKTKVVPFDLAKCLADGGKCFTSLGHKARIIATDRKGDSHKLVALITDDSAPGGPNEFCHTFREDGTHNTSGRGNLYLVLHEQYKTVEGCAVVYRYDGRDMVARTPVGMSEEEVVNYYRQWFDQSACELLGVAKYTVEVKV